MNINSKVFFFALFSILIISDSAKAQSFTDSLAQNLPEWTAYWKETHSEFDFSKFEKVDEKVRKKLYLAWETLPPDSTVKREESSKDDITTTYSKSLIYSPDSLRVLDIYSYHLHLSHSKSGHLEGSFHIDSEAMLSDFEKHEKGRLLFITAVMTFDDAFWLDNHRLVIAGHSEHDDLQRPIFWKIDIAEHTFELFQYPEELKRPGENYLFRKFRNVDFERK